MGARAKGPFEHCNNFATFLDKYVCDFVSSDAQIHDVPAEAQRCDLSQKQHCSSADLWLQRASSRVQAAMHLPCAVLNREGAGVRRLPQEGGSSGGHVCTLSCTWASPQPVGDSDVTTTRICMHLCPAQCVAAETKGRLPAVSSPETQCRLMVDKTQQRPSAQDRLHPG